MKFSLVLVASSLPAAIQASQLPVGKRIAPKYYSCNESTGFCERITLSSSSSSLSESFFSSQEQCLLTCKGTIWPKPSDITHMETSKTASFCEVQFEGYGEAGEKYEAMAKENFLESLQVSGKKRSFQNCDGSSAVLQVVMASKEEASSPLTLRTDESYSLVISTGSDGNSRAVITSETFYGGRHGLETLSQLIATDSDRFSSTYGLHTIATNVEINDAPAFPYRGIMLDTSRNYLSMDSIKNVIRRMGYNKLNRLHLHFTDTASFPLQVDSEPNLFTYGGYSSDMYYDTERINELMEFAHGYGVSIIPEVDVPSHVNMGWNWGQSEGLGDLAICTSDWTTTSLEPPAGHLNIANEAVYPILQNIYSFLGQNFDFPDIFHVGGDEVVVGSDETYAACWNSTEYGTEILNLLSSLGLSRDDQESFYTLWHRFTHRIVDMIDNAYKSSSLSSPMNIIWGGNVEPDVGSSPVTYNMVARPDVETELPPSSYIMEIWDESTDSIAPELLGKGYQIIAANYDYVYMDCGQPGFTNPGGYWCGPDHEWSHIYQYMHDLQKKWDLKSSGEAKEGTGKIIGSEVLLWGEENGDSSVMTKIFPRAAALAESLWSNPQPEDATTALWYGADPRIQLWRNKLASRGIAAAEMQPLWCAQNGPYSCTIDEGIPQ